MADTRACGHEKTEENTRYVIKNGKRRSDGCKPCRNEYLRKRGMEKRRAAGILPTPTVEDFPDSKRCANCKEVKHLDEFYSSSQRQGGYSRGKQSRCKSCSDEVNKERRRTHPHEQTRINNEGNKRLRLEGLTHYSKGTPKCACCGETWIPFLVFDHINNDGAEHRKLLASSGHVVRDLRKNGWPEGIQILCCNCNWGKWSGGCPDTHTPGITGTVRSTGTQASPLSESNVARSSDVM